MPFVVFCLDKPGHHEVRLQHYDAHKAYQAAAPESQKIGQRHLISLNGL